MSAPSGPALAARIRSIFSARGLSLADVSRASRLLVLGGPLSHIPHNFYSWLRKRRFSPSLYQLVALSAVSGYRLVDWLAVFGFSLDNVPRFHASLSTLRTIELDSNIYQSRVRIPWFYDLKQPDFSLALAPLSQWLAPGAPRAYDSLANTAGAAYRYVKIGSEDAFAFPELLPGSIVRVSRRVDALKRTSIGQKSPRGLFLVEHSNGFTCSRLHRSEGGKIVLCSRQLPYAPVEFDEGTEAAVLGSADLEIRPINGAIKPVVSSRLGRYWTPTPIRKYPPVVGVGDFVRRARERSGLSFREASKRTRWIAKELHDSRYYCSPGALSDCETRKLPPRHIHKLISICAVYFAKPSELLEAAGAALDSAGMLPMPEEFVGRSLRPADSSVAPSLFLGEMERRFKQLPYFLHSALSLLFGLQDLSVRDVFWAGGAEGSRHTYSAGALFLIVDRKQKIPRASLSSPVWEQPAYILQRRDGGYLWGFCTLQNGTLIVRACTAKSPKLLKLRHRVDAEVVGRVVGIVRRLKPISSTTKS